MPEVPAVPRPASTSPTSPRAAATTSRRASPGSGRPSTIRYLGNSDHNLTDDPSRPARAQLWIRVNGRLADDPSDHLAAFTYASDMTLLGAALVPHGVTIGDPRLQPASLDHSIWFHRPFRADEWWLYDQWSPSASGARGLALARVFTQDGTLVATVAQEGLIRMRG